MLVPIIFICLATFVNGKACENNQFWSSILESCENCSRCVSPDIVLRPCQRYADTVCGPLSELNIDWTWLTHQGSHATGNGKHGKKKEMVDTSRENYSRIHQHELHVKNKQRYQRRKHDKESDESSEEIESGDIFVGNRFKFKKDDNEKNNLKKQHKFQSKHKSLEEKLVDDVPSMNGRNRNQLENSKMNLKIWQKLLRTKSDNSHLHFNDEEASELFKSSRKDEKKINDTYDPNHLKFDKNGILIKNFGFTKIEEEVKMEKLVDDVKFADFSTTEKFIFDWQTVILGLAVSSCIIFFLVAAIYSLQHAKHWKKLKNYFDADVEELQSWISSKKSDNKTIPSGIYKATTEVVHKEGSQCKYLERIIKMNSKSKMNFVKGNVYEKDNNKKSSELKPLTKNYPTVHRKIEDRI